MANDVIAVEFNDISKNFNGVKAVDNVNFKIYEGEFFGLLGPNGAGKSTLIKMLIGLVSPSSGTARVFGMDVVKEYRKVHSLIGFAPSEANLDREFNVIDNLKFYGGYFGVRKKERGERAERFLRMMDLWGKRDLKPYALSTGMRRKLLIARALMSDPDILILDEPTSGLDVETRLSIHKYLKEINRTIILTTHAIDEVEKLCDRTAIMNNGRVLTIDSPDELTKNKGKDIIEISLHKNIKTVPKALTKSGYEVSMNDENNRIRAFATDGGSASIDILESLMNAGLGVKSIEIKTTSLEEIFLKITGSDKDEEK